MRRRALFALGPLTLLALGLAACAPQEQVDPAAQQAAEDLAWLKENKPILDAKRQELDELNARLASDAPAAEEEGDEGEPLTPEELEAQSAALKSEIEQLTEDVGKRVVDYLNNANISVGAELTPDQQFAVDVKIGEDIVVAKEYIEKGGNYKRALEIYNSDRQLDTDNEMLMAAIAEAEELRWMSEERFGQCKKGMSQDEVREVLGQVMPRNVQEYPERNVVAWFYRKEAGGAAGVFFKEKKKGQGDWVVYNLDYNAVKPQVIEDDD